MESTKHEFRVRAVTSFMSLTADDFEPKELSQKIGQHASFLRTMEQLLTNHGYEVQTLRIATNPFGEYLAPVSDPDLLQEQLHLLDQTLQSNSIEFFAMGPATNPSEMECCPIIVSTSHRLSCSANMEADNIIMAKKAAECMQSISRLSTGPHCENGLGNFRFCVTACCQPYAPFFPGARSASLSEDSYRNSIPFALGLENGTLARRLLMESKTLDKISSVFRLGMEEVLRPLAELCDGFSNESQGKVRFVGIDTSLNPSLEEGGSVAAAVEQIDIVEKFGGKGSIAVAAEITKAIKSIPGIVNVGYSGLMLPVMEDSRLAALSSSGEMDTTRLLALSSVCGVGLDTVPISGHCSTSELMALILDVSSIAFRYNKNLSCRLLLCPGQKGGERANIQSPYLCDCNIFH